MCHVPCWGASFFSDEGFLIDLQNRCLVSRSGVRFPAVSTRRPGINCLRLPTAGPYEALLDSYPSLLTLQYTGEVKHNRKTSSHSTTTIGRREAPYSEGRILENGIPRHCPSFGLTLGFSITCSPQGGWQLATVWQLPQVEHRHHR